MALQPVNSEGRLRAGMRFGTATRKKSTDAPPEEKNKRSGGTEVEESTAWREKRAWRRYESREKYRLERKKSVAAVRK